MQRTLNLERDIFVSQRTESFCLVCETNLDSASSINIFYSYLPRYGELLATFIVRVLSHIASDLRSPYICAACHNLFCILEQAQWTVSNVKSEILKIYHSRETNLVQEPKNELSSSQILQHNDIFNESSEEEKNHLIDITGLRSLDTERNEFDSLSIVINNLEESRDVYGKKEIANSIALPEPVEYKFNNVVRSSVFNFINETDIEKSLITDKATKNSVKIDSQFGANIPRESTKNSFRENHENCVENLNIISNKLLKNSTIHESNNYDESLNDISNELLNNSKRESNDNAREIIPQISSELKKNVMHKTLERENAREIIDELSSSLKKNLNAEIEKKSSYTLQCGVCNRLFKSSKDLQSHTLKHGTSRPYHCRECGERFAELSRANDHALEFHLSMKNSISVSNKPLENEIVDFSNEDWILPDNYRSDELKDLTESIEFGKIDNDDSSRCAYGVETKNDEKNERPSWKSGRISKYSLKPLKYSCSTCGKKWRTSAELKTHVKSHSNLRPYMCEKCGQAYKHKHALEIHVGMHNGVSPFQCSVCNKCFTQKGALMRHLPMHTGETPYQCELCGKRFVHHTSYNMHALSHTGKKSFQCHVCDMSLLSTSHLKRHMRVHTGEKPYSCTLCGKSFAERYNLFAHQKIHDPVEIMAKAAKKMNYKCERCDECFDKKQKLEEHTNDRHNNSIISHNDLTNGRKWIGHTIEVENPACNNDTLIEQSWQDLDYAKIQSAAMKTTQNENQLSQLSHESIAMLMSQTNYNKGMSVVIQSTNSTTNAEIDQSQIRKLN